ncbi:MAG: hypothetical protein H0U92_15280 [Actinobacteria bacterium]|nr:hypothetical protein [Actinomycetota bacterium]
MTFPGGWTGIRLHGMKTALQFDEKGGGELRGDVRSVKLDDGTVAQLRNQKPQRIDPAPYLKDITVPEWWRLVNGRSYFFCRELEAEKFVATYLKLGHPQELVKLRTSLALKAVANQVEVTTVNAGVFPRSAVPERGRMTFQILSDVPAADVRKIKEVTVVGGIPSLEAAVTTVVLRDVDESRKRLFP